MREILFKAKRIENGKWVQGYLFIIWERAYILWGTTNDVPNMIEVDANTICQYTGLTDKNGNKIWENDVIRYEEIHAIGKVAFMEDTFVLDDEYDGKQYINGMWDKFEVIGNIFDNADLVKE